MSSLPDIAPTDLHRELLKIHRSRHEEPKADGYRWTVVYTPKTGYVSAEFWRGQDQCSLGTVHVVVARDLYMGTTTCEYTVNPRGCHPQPLTTAPLDELLHNAEFVIRMGAARYMEDLE